MARHSWATTLFAVAFAGQAASLRMIDAGPLVRYQHYPPLTTLFFAHPWPLAILALQSVASVIAYAWLGRASGSGSRSLPTVSHWRIGLAIVLSACTAATVSADVARYIGELAFAAYVQILSIATIVLAVMAVPADSIERFDARLNHFLGERDRPEANADRPALNRIAWIAAFVAAGIGVALTVLVYERHPHIPDEVAYLYQARYFATGAITMPPPPVPAAFDVDLMTYDPTRWFSPLSPGWPAMLAVGVFAGVPWLINPLFAGINVLLASLVFAQLYPRRVAMMATVLIALSPWSLFLSMSFMPHTFTLTCALIGAVAVVSARRTGGFWWGALAGVAIGVTSLLRPLDGLLVGGLLVAWSLGIGGPRLSPAPLAGMLLCAAIVGGLILPYNRALTGDPLVFPVNAYFDRYYHLNANAYGFGPDRGVGWPIDPNPGHSPLDGLINADLNTFGVNTDLFGWSTGSLIFVALLLCFERPGRGDRLMLASIVAVVVAYFFYYFSGGPDFAARYWFLIIVPLVALTARGIEVMKRCMGARVELAVIAVTAMALLNFVPWRALDKYHHFRGMRPDVRMLASEYQFGPDLVLIRGNRSPDYASAVLNNPLDLSSASPIYAWDRSADVRTDLLRTYPDRRVWLVDGPSITGGGFKVVQSPAHARAGVPR